MLCSTASRDKDIGWDAEHRVPVYVLALCEALAGACRARGAAGVTREHVLQKDALAAGHTDYQHKLARYYCVELAVGSR